MSPSPEMLAADAVETIADGAAAPGLAELVDQLVGLKDQIDTLEQEKKGLQERYDALRKQAIPEKLHELGLTGAKFPVGTLALHNKMYARVPKEMQAECRTWCLAHGHEDLLTVHSSTILGLASELVENGTPVPAFITTYTEPMAVLTRKGARTK